MTIYFDENKQAHAYEIQNTIAFIENEIWQNYANTDKWDIINGAFTDISETQEYNNKIAQEQKDTLKVELQKQIEELDVKRIRAIAEPSLKDASAGETWLDYYTSQIQDKRNQISTL